MFPNGNNPWRGFCMTEILVVGSKVKEEIKKYDCNTAGDAVDALSKVVEGMVKKAAERAKANGRKTVRAEDF
mgnify:CR=1 FL=1